MIACAVLAAHDEICEFASLRVIRATGSGHQIAVALRYYHKIAAGAANCTEIYCTVEGTYQTYSQETQSVWK